MRNYVHRFLILAVLMMVSIMAAERPDSVSAKSAAERGSSSLCVGSVPPSGGYSQLASNLLDLVPKITGKPPWESLFASPVNHSSTPDPTRFTGTRPLILGLPEDNALAPPRSPGAPAETVDVSVGSNFFSPNMVRITAGDTVRWTWDASLHTVTSGNCCTPNGIFCSPSNNNCGGSPVSNAGAVYTHTFNTAGTLPYFCRVHGPAMTGMVIVDPAPAGTTVQFDAANYNATEGCVSAIIVVTRSGDTSGTATVDFLSSDGSALQRSDYTIASGTLSFAAGQTSRTFRVLATEDAYVEESETLNVTLSNATGGTLGTQSTATVTIADNDTAHPPTTQPIDDTATFVCQHYHDFLSREPDAGGFDFWKNQITQCGSDEACIRNKRLDVSNAFFFELEFQQTGAYVFRLYRAAYGNDQPFPNPSTSDPTEGRKLPSYAVFSRDRAKVIGGSNLPAKQVDLANVFVGRPEFLVKYPASLGTADQFVDAVLATIQTDLGVNLSSQRNALITLYQNSGGRAAVMYRLADDNLQTNPINNRSLIDAEYNRAFVTTQYFGYLRRNPDIPGLLFWLGQVNSAPLRDVSKQHAMVCSFITSTEYQQRFSSVVTHSNSECPP